MYYTRNAYEKEFYSPFYDCNFLKILIKIILRGGRDYFTVCHQGKTSNSPNDKPKISTWIREELLSFMSS